jgi:hypothetical protein
MLIEHRPANPQVNADTLPIHGRFIADFPGDLAAFGPQTTKMFAQRSHHFRPLAIESNISRSDMYFSHKSWMDG